MPKLIQKRMRSCIVRFLDKTLSGNSITYHHVVAIIVPLLVDQAFIILMGLLNTAMISSSGQDAVAAVSMIDSLNIFLLNFFIGVATGGTVVVAQYKGAGHEKEVPRVAAQAVSAVFIVAFAVGLLILILRIPVTGFLFGGAQPTVLSNARLYLTGSVITYPFIGIVEAVCGALRGVGETKSSLWLSVITNGSYMLLNVLFITVLKMSISGLVTALFLSRALGMICSLVYIVKIHKTFCFRFQDLFHVELPQLKKILLLGIPFAAEQLFFNGGKLLTQTFIVSLGTASNVIFAISNSVCNLFCIGANACCLAVIPVVGQCIGRRDIADARKFIRSFNLLASLSYLLTEALLMPFMGWIIGLFAPEPAIVPTIRLMIWITAIGYPIIWSLSFITPSALRAAGDANFTSISSLLSMWLVRVVLGYVLGIVLHFGIVGVWSAMVIEWFFRALIFQLRLRGKKWYSHSLVSDG